MLRVKDSNSTTGLVSQMDRVPRPPRPVETDSDSSESGLYIYYQPAATQSNSQSFDDEHFNDEASASGDLSRKQKRMSRVSFSEMVKVISSDDECEDQIESISMDLENKCGPTIGCDGNDLKAGSQSQHSNPIDVVPQETNSEVLPDAISATSILLKSPKSKSANLGMGFSTLIRDEFQNVLKKDQIKSSITDWEENCALKKGLVGNDLKTENESTQLNHSKFKNMNNSLSDIHREVNHEEKGSAKEGFSGNDLKPENQLPQLHHSKSELSSTLSNTHQDFEVPPDYTHIFPPPIPPRLASSAKSKLAKSKMGFSTMLRNEFQSVLIEKVQGPPTSSQNKKRPNVTSVFRKPSEPPPLPPKGIRNTEPTSGAEQIEVTDGVAKNEECFDSVRDPAETPTTSSRQHLTPTGIRQSIPNESPKSRRYSNEEFEQKEHFSYQTETEKKSYIIISDLCNSEKNYVNLLKAGLQIKDELKSVRISEETLDTFFGFLEDVLLLHKTFLRDLYSKNKTTKNILLCFLKHFISNDVYIKRQWLVRCESDLDQFERSLVERGNLKQYLSITKGRVQEYIKVLRFLKTHCDEQDNDNIEIARRASRVMENLSYQLEMVDQFKKMEDRNGKLKICGCVYLNCLFKVQYRSNNHIYLVYLCENSIILTCEQDRIYRYVDDLPISYMYCRTRKNKPKKFEIGIKHEKCYILKASTEAVKDQWCERLRNMLQFDHFVEE